MNYELFLNVKRCILFYIYICILEYIYVDYMSRCAQVRKKWELDVLELQLHAFMSYQDVNAGK